FRMGGLICACAWSPDGKILAAGNASFSGDNAVTLFDAATGKPIRTLRGQQSFVTSLAFSPDGRTLASGSQAGIVLCDSARGKLLRQFSSKPGQPVQVRSLAFTLDGKGLISAGEDKQVRLWDTVTGNAIRQFTGNELDVRCAVVSPDGQM